MVEGVDCTVQYILFKEDIISCLEFVLDCERLRLLVEEEETVAVNRKRAEEIR